MNRPIDEPTLIRYALNQMDEAERSRVDSVLAGSAEDRAALQSILEILKPAVRPPREFLDRIKESAARSSVPWFEALVAGAVARFFDAPGSVIPPMPPDPALVPLSSPGSARTLLDLGQAAVAFAVRESKEGFGLSADLVRAPHRDVVLHCEREGVPIEEVPLSRQALFESPLRPGVYRMTLTWPGGSVSFDLSLRKDEQ